MRYIMVFLLLCSAVLADGMGVSVNVLPFSAQWSNYDQLSDSSQYTSATMSVPLAYSGSGTSIVTADIPSWFSSGYNFTVYEDGVPVFTNRTGDVLTWNATLNTSATIEFQVPPPTITLGPERISNTYTRTINISASTPLRNASFFMPRPSGYGPFRLLEFSSQTLDRTQTYNLNVGANISFTNVFFTDITTNRSLMLTAEVPALPKKIYFSSRRVNNTIEVNATIEPPPTKDEGTWIVIRDEHGNNIDSHFETAKSDNLTYQFNIANLPPSTYEVCVRVVSATNSTVTENCSPLRKTDLPGQEAPTNVPKTQSPWLIISLAIAIFAALTFWRIRKA